MVFLSFGYSSRTVRVQVNYGPCPSRLCCRSGGGGIDNSTGTVDLMKRGSMVRVCCIPVVCSSNHFVSCQQCRYASSLRTYEQNRAAACSSVPTATAVPVATTTTGTAEATATAVPVATATAEATGEAEAASVPTATATTRAATTASTSTGTATTMPLEGSKPSSSTGQQVVLTAKVITFDCKGRCGSKLISDWKYCPRCGFERRDVD